MGFIKGSVGDDFVIPCIDFIVTATTARQPTGRGRRLPAHGLAGRPLADRRRRGAGTGAVAVARDPGSFDAGYQWLEVPAMTATMRASSR